MSPSGLDREGQSVTLSTNPNDVIDILAGVNPMPFLLGNVVFGISASETSRDFPTIYKHSSTFQNEVNVFLCDVVAIVSQQLCCPELLHELTANVFNTDECSDFFKAHFVSLSHVAMLSQSQQVVN